ASGNIASTSVVGKVGYAQGISGSAFQFDGQLGNYVVVDPGAAITGTQAFALELWFKVRRGSNTLITQRDGANWLGYGVYTNPYLSPKTSVF
ncbi:MAG: hypothetical protein ACKO5E_08980, partial [bacterium]